MHYTVQNKFTELENQLQNHSVIRCNCDHIRDHLVTTFLVPGLSKEEISIRVDNDGIIVVTTTPKNSTEGESETGFDIVPSAALMYAGPECVDLSKIESTLKNGILTISIPFRTEPRVATNTRQIKIN